MGPIFAPHPRRPFSISSWRPPYCIGRLARPNKGNARSADRGNCRVAFLTAGPCDPMAIIGEKRHLALGRLTRHLHAQLHYHRTPSLRGLDSGCGSTDQVPDLLLSRARVGARQLGLPACRNVERGTALTGASPRPPVPRPMRLHSIFLIR